MGGFSGTGDSRAIGWEDDGSNQGVIRHKTAISGLVRVPFRDGQFTVGGTSSAEYPVLKEEIFRYNSDGTGSGLTVSITAGVAGTTKFGRLKFLFSGRVFGLRWAKSYVSSGSPRDFTVIIDGEPYAIDNQVISPDDGYTVWSTPSGEVCEIVADDLADGTHTCEIVFQGDTDQTNRWTILGYAVESRIAAAPTRPRLSLCNPQALTTSMQTLDLSHHADGTENNATGVKAIYYSNSTAGAVAVTIEAYYTTTATTLAVLSVPANGTVSFDFGDVVAIDHASGSGKRTVRHKAGSSSAITATVLGGM